MHDVCIVGLGYVGLPTACAFANSGLDTVGVDTRAEVVDKVSRGESHLTEAGLGLAVRKAVKSGKLHVVHDLRSAVSESKSVVIAVQTPFENGAAVLGHLEKAVTQVADAIRPGTVVILESTVPPGTCRKLVLPLLEKKGRKEGKDFYFAYCPERMAPGNSLAEFTANDRLVGADGKTSAEKAEALMKKAVTGKLIRADIDEIEVAKLAENTARDVYIAFANDLAKLSKRLGVDVREVIRLANTHPRVKILNPGPGVGGPCLTKDPYLLLEGLQDDGSGAGNLVRAARSLNEKMYEEVISLFNEGGAPPRGSRVAVLGTAYKPEVGDPRASPSQPVIEHLISQGYDVRATDPYCLESFGAKMEPGVPEASKGAAAMLVLVAHKEYRGLDFDRVASAMARDPRIVDAVGMDNLSPGSKKYTLRRLGDGRAHAEPDGAR